MLIDRREFMLAAAGTAVPRVDTHPAPIVTPEMFGAAGDGVTNDTAAFTALSGHIQKAGGGTVMLSHGRTYMVGHQTRGSTRAFSPASLIELRKLWRPLIVLGGGAELKAAAGLHYGSFNPDTGVPVDAGMPNPDQALVASPYRAMILVRESRAPVTILDVVLNGNSPTLILGGHWGDAGRQIAGSGLILVDNAAEERIENVISHHQPLDGAMISSQSARSVRSRVSRLVCRFNGRQGLSFTGGRGYEFLDCLFGETGRSAVRSPPAAGVDLEGEDQKTIRDLTFTRCHFINNVGAGMGADTGDCADVHFRECLFVGTTNWCAWPRKPRFSFDRCTFAGALVHAFGSQDQSSATRFVGCLFTDDPHRSPTGALYFSGGQTGPVVDLDASENVLFDGCRFDLRYRGVLPWTTRAIYRNCFMAQHSRKEAMTRGKYLGQTVISGPVSLYGSMIDGEVYLNGKLLRRGPVGSDFKPW